MTVCFAQWHRLACWNPSTGTLHGTVSTLQYILIEEMREHIGQGVTLSAPDRKV